MEKMVTGGKIVGILSNATQLAAKEIEKLRHHGIVQGRHFHFLLTSGEIAKRMLKAEMLPFKTPHKKYWLLCGGHLKFSTHEAIFKDTAFMETLRIDEADFIYVTTPHINGEDQIDPELFRAQVQKLAQSGLPMVCTNPDRFAHEGNPPRAVVRQGSLAAMYEAFGGEVFYIGKPSSKAFASAMEEFYRYDISNPADVLMVGDTPETDIRGARQFGMASALITRTGIMADRLAKADLQTAIRGFSEFDHPHYFIERLAHD